MPGKKKPEKKIAAKKAPPIQGAPVVQVSEGTAPLAPIPPPPPTTDVDFLERQAAMRAVASQANSEGHLALVLGDEAPNPYIIRRPTGIMNLDIDLGGGFPAGGTCFVSGLDCVGKTWLMLLTMAMQQMIYGDRCIEALAITEGGFPYDVCMNVGLQIPERPAPPG